MTKAALVRMGDNKVICAIDTKLKGKTIVRVWDIFHQFNARISRDKQYLDQTQHAVYEATAISEKEFCVTWL